MLGVLWQDCCIGADESQVGQVLGIRDNSAVRALLFRPRPSLAGLIRCLL